MAKKTINSSKFSKNRQVYKFLLVCIALFLIIWWLTVEKLSASQISSLLAVLVILLSFYSIKIIDRHIKKHNYIQPKKYTGKKEFITSTPDAFRELFHQLNTSLKDRSYFYAIFLPRLEKLLATKIDSSKKTSLQKELIDRSKECIPSQRISFSFFKYQKHRTRKLLSLLEEITKLP